MTTPTIETSILIDALDALRDARVALGTSSDRGQYHIAERIAIAEGRLRGQLKNALPATIEIRT